VANNPRTSTPVISGDGIPLTDKVKLFGMKKNRYARRVSAIHSKDRVILSQSERDALSKRMRRDTEK